MYNIAWCLSVPGNQEVMKLIFPWNIHDPTDLPHPTYPFFHPTCALHTQINTVFLVLALVNLRKTLKEITERTKKRGMTKHADLAT